MNKLSGSTTTTAVLSVLTVVGMGFGLLGFATALKVGKDTMGKVRPLERTVHELEMRLAHLDRRGPGGPGPRPALSGAGAGAVDPMAGMSEATMTGMLASAQNLNPDVVSRMYDSYLRSESLKKNQQSLLQRNRQQMQADFQKYGKQVLDLFAAARPASKDDPAAQKASDTAFSSLVSQYPEANATGMAIADRALASALDQNSADVLQYYNQLKSSDAYAHVVTDNGIEAVPTLESYLVQDYLSKGQVSQAQAMIADMKNNYSDSVIMDRSPDSVEPTWRTVSDVAANLQKLVDMSGSSGGSPPPPSGPPK